MAAAQRPSQPRAAHRCFMRCSVPSGKMDSGRLRLQKKSVLTAAQGAEARAVSGLECSGT